MSYKESDVVNITFMIWPLVQRMRNIPMDDFINSVDFQAFVSILQTHCLQIHECVLEGPSFSKERIQKEPYLTYFFEDTSSLFDWLCLHGSLEYVPILRKFYETIEHYRLMEQMNQTIESISLSEIQFRLEN